MFTYRIIGSSGNIVKKYQSLTPSALLNFRRSLEEMASDKDPLLEDILSLMREGVALAPSVTSHTPVRTQQCSLSRIHTHMFLVASLSSVCIQLDRMKEQLKSKFQDVALVDAYFRKRISLHLISPTPHNVYFLNPTLTAYSGTIIPTECFSHAQMFPFHQYFSMFIIRKADMNLFLHNRKIDLASLCRNQLLSHHFQSCSSMKSHFWSGKVFWNDSNLSGVGVFEAGLPSTITLSDLRVSLNDSTQYSCHGMIMLEQPISNEIMTGFVSLQDQEWTIYCIQNLCLIGRALSVTEPMIHHKVDLTKWFSGSGNIEDYFKLDHRSKVLDNLYGSEIFQQTEPEQKIDILHESPSKSPTPTLSVTCFENILELVYKGYLDAIYNEQSEVLGFIEEGLPSVYMLINDLQQNSSEDLIERLFTIIRDEMIMDISVFENKYKTFSSRVDTCASASTSLSDISGLSFSQMEQVFIHHYVYMAANEAANFKESCTRIVSSISAKVKLKEAQIQILLLLECLRIKKELDLNIPEKKISKSESKLLYQKGVEEYLDMLVIWHSVLDGGDLYKSFFEPIVIDFYEESLSELVTLLKQKIGTFQPTPQKSKRQILSPFSKKFQKLSQNPNRSKKTKCKENKEEQINPTIEITDILEKRSFSFRNKASKKKRKKTVDDKLKKDLMFVKKLRGTLPLNAKDERPLFNSNRLPTDDLCNPFLSHEPSSESFRIKNIPTEKLNLLENRMMKREDKHVLVTETPISNRISHSVDMIAESPIGKISWE